MPVQGQLLAWAPERQKSVTGSQLFGNRGGSWIGLFFRGVISLSFNDSDVWQGRAMLATVRARTGTWDSCVRGGKTKDQ